MPRAHALLVGITDHHPEQRFIAGPSLDAITALLGDLATRGETGSSWTITRLEGAAATRPGVLAALAELEGAVGPDDRVLFYFAGHGGIVNIADLPPPFAGRPVFYLACARTEQAWQFTGILDIELSLALARLDRVCGNVTAILDCCYAAGVVRGPSWVLAESPPWLRTLAANSPAGDCDPLLHPGGHPRILRLAGSSSLRSSFPERRENGHLGRLTGAFVAVLREADLQIARLDWDAVVHRVREQVIWDLGCEAQWVTLAGPRRRLLFSRDEAPASPSVAFVPRAGHRDGWIRAGVLQGVEVGDEWGLTELTLDRSFRPRWRARVRVTAVDLNRATVEAVDDPDVDRRHGPLSGAPPGTRALLLGVERRVCVLVDGPRSLRDAVLDSTWLTPFSGEASEPGRELLAALSRRSHGLLEVRSAGERFAPACFPDDRDGLRAAIERLEGWARARRLLTAAQAGVGRDGPITMTVYRDRGPRSRPEPLDAGARLHVGERLRCTISCATSERSRFVTVILIDAAGRATLLDDAEPEGREILAGERIDIGTHAHRRQQGITLPWPEGVDDSDRQARPLTILVLSSSRPIALGHLILAGSGAANGIPNDAPRKSRARTRGRLSQPRPRTGPELARDWSALQWQGLLDPRPAE